MEQTRKITEYLLGWGLWAVTSALGVFIMFWAVRGAFSALVEAATMGAMLTGTPSERFQVPFIRNAMERFGTLIMGILAVLMIVLVEYYYRNGVETGTLWRRFTLVTAIEFGVLFVALAIQVIFMGALGLFTVWSLVLPCAALAVTVFLSWLLTRRDGHAASP